MSIGIFLDRDGTINEEVDFLSSPTQLRLIPGSAEAIKIANQLGLKVFIITNQLINQDDNYMENIDC